MDGFVHALVEAMTVPIQNRDSAASVVPLVAKVPAEVVDKIKHLTFASPLDPMAKDMREEAIRRIGLGMDSDPSVLLGIGSSSNHWSAWLTSDEEVKLVIAPMVSTVCHALTVGWLRPSLEQLGVDPNKYLVWFSTSNLTLRPDKSEDARALHGEGVLSDEAVMRENGFNPDEDMASDEERARRLLTQLLMVKPDYAEAILPRLGVELVLPQTVPAEPAASPADTPPEDAPPDGATPNDIPERPTKPETDVAPPEGNQ
jgi:hypothetical protein